MITELSTPMHDIETAPRDGTLILLYGGRTDSDEASPAFVVGWRNNGEWRYCSYDSGVYGEYLYPSHWSPLPAQPEPSFDRRRPWTVVGDNVYWLEDDQVCTGKLEQRDGEYEAYQLLRIRFADGTETVEQFFNSHFLDDFVEDAEEFKSEIRHSNITGANGVYGEGTAN